MAPEALVRAFRGIHTFRGESAFSTWLAAIAMNSYRSWLRDHPPVPIDVELTGTRGHEPDAHNMLLRARVTNVGERRNP